MPACLYIEYCGLCHLPLAPAPRLVPVGLVHVHSGLGAVVALHLPGMGHRGGVAVGRTR